MSRGPVALITGALMCGGALSATPAPAAQEPPAAVAATGPRDLAKRVTIPGGRRLFLQCQGTGSPTVVFEAGTGDLGQIWSMTEGGRTPVFPAVARFTRACVYDRPGTYLLPRQFSRSDPVAMPRTARDIVADLQALLTAADVPGPYVLVGHSFGGMVARLFATTHPEKTAALVSIDAQNGDFVAAYKRLLSAQQYSDAVLDPGPPPGLESYSALERLSLEASAAQVQQSQADTPLRSMPVTVISHSRDLVNPFGFPPDWPAAELETDFQQSQDRLAKIVPGARHLVAEKSGHYIQLDQPRLVVRAIRAAVRAVRHGQ